MKKVLIIPILAAFIASPAMAKKFGPAGCGLGSMLFKKDSQILAATTNGTSGSQTFGITTGTSNCTDDGVAKRSAELKLFIESNKMALATDLARGQGDLVSSLSKIMNCSSDKVGSVLKRNYSAIYPTQSADSEEVTDSIKKVIRSNPDLGCQVS